MAAKWTLDYLNRLFILKPGVVSLDVQIDLYSDWKEEVIQGDNTKHAPAMRTVGGDPISPTQSLGDTYFLINGYRIRPQEADHELNIVGNIFTDPTGESLVVPTLGGYTVLVTNTVSNIIDIVIPILDQQQLAAINTNAELARKILQNKTITNPATGKINVYDDDDTPLLEGNLYQDVAGTQPYQGQGADRRERLE